SLFRIYRDTRFSRDKHPYKTHAGLSFRHAAGRDVHGPIFYLHIQPGRVFGAAGMWHPPPDAVKSGRAAIVAHPDPREPVVRACPLRYDEDRLKRVPRGHDPAHPLAEELKRQTFITSADFSEAQASRRDFLDRFSKACRRASPLMEFLAQAVGLRW